MFIYSYFRCATNFCHATAYTIDAENVIKVGRIANHAPHCHPDGKHEVIKMKDFMRKELENQGWKFLDLYKEAFDLGGQKNIKNILFKI